MQAAAFSHTMRARQLATSGSYSRAFDLYITAIELCPELKTRVEREFRRLLDRYNRHLLSLNKVGDIFHNLERAIVAYPQSVAILNEIAGYLYKFGYLREACAHYQKALSIDAAFVTAEKNLNSVKNVMVERWHFRMLNDRVRNEAYREAVAEVIRPMKETILDLGTGTGLLAVYAHQCIPMMITACDRSDPMIEIARLVLEENNIDNIILVNKMSNTMTFRDIGGKRTLIMTEVFDAGLFGEGVLQSLVHAHEYLMAINGRILPTGAELFVAGVESDCLSNKYRLGAPALALLNLQGSKVHLMNVEPYDAEDIANIRDAKFITETKSVLKVDFNNVEDMKEKLEESSKYEVNLLAKQSGNVNVIIAWFNLHLTDNVMITTNPMEEGRAKAWQQAVFYDFKPRCVSTDEMVSLQFTTFDGKLSLLEEDSDVSRISPDMIRFLNDEDYIKLISNSIGSICIYLCQINEVAHLNLLDFSPFPVLGLLMLKRGAQHLTCSAKCTEDKDFILKVFEANNIPLEQVTILIDEEVSTDTFKGQKFHVIYINMNELNGDISCKQRELMRHLKISCLFTGGLMLPRKVILEGQLISSEWLQYINKVDDANTLTCKVANFINQYQVSQNLHIDIAHLEYKCLSRVATIANCTENIPSEVINVEIIENGEVNAVICWYKIQLTQHGDIISTDRRRSFVDCMAFLADPKVRVIKGDVGNILCCADADQSFKLLMDVDAQ